MLSQIVALLHFKISYDYNMLIHLFPDLPVYTASVHISTVRQARSRYCSLHAPCQSITRQTCTIWHMLIASHPSLALLEIVH